MDIIAARNALAVQIEELHAQRDRDASEMRSLQRHLHDVQVCAHYFQKSAP